MSITVTIHDSTFDIPERKESRWSLEVTNLLEELANICSRLNGTPLSSQTVAAGGTISPSAQHLRLSGDSAAVDTDGTTAISDGSIDGEVLVLEGGDATNTVTVLDGANTDLNGDCELGTGNFQTRMLTLRWNEGRSLWVEQFRSH